MVAREESHHAASHSASSLQVCTAFGTAGCGAVTAGFLLGLLLAASRGRGLRRAAVPAHCPACAQNTNAGTPHHLQASGSAGRQQGDSPSPVDTPWAEEKH